MPVPQFFPLFPRRPKTSIELFASRFGHNPVARMATRFVREWPVGQYTLSRSSGFFRWSGLAESCAVDWNINLYGIEFCHRSAVDPRFGYTKRYLESRNVAIVGIVHLSGNKSKRRLRSNAPSAPEDPIGESK